MPTSADYYRNRESYAAYAKTAAGRSALRKYRQSDKYRKVSIRYHLKKKFGLTEQDVERMFAAQQGRCGICQRPITMTPGSDKTSFRHVDHDHAKRKGEPGHIRGLLCQNCNTGIGLLRDDPVILIQAADYLGRLAC